ncbi:MAG: hypothetical protein AB2L14_20785 [Candidatus Xenobiia bacterium LiM19]
MDLPDTISIIIIVFLMINLFLALFVHRDALSAGMNKERAMMWAVVVFTTSLAGAVVYVLVKTVNEMLSRKAGNEQSETL